MTSSILPLFFQNLHFVYFCIDSMAAKHTSESIALVWDSSILFEKLFLEYGFSCMRIDPTALGSPYLPQFGTIIIPTGFANTKYTAILSQLNRKKQFLFDFLCNGGNVLVFGAAIEKFDYDFLPCDISYVEQYGSVRLESSGEPGNLIVANGDTQECDGYFDRCEGDAVLLNEGGHCVMSVSHHGKGKVVATTLHEYPPRDFISWLVGI